MPLVREGGPALEPEPSEARMRARKIQPELTRGPLVRVAHARNQAEAELIQNMLLEEGVPSILRRSAGFDVPDFLAAGPRDVLVPASGADIARMTLTEADIEAVPSIVPGAPSRRHVARLAAAVTGGAGLTALIAWALAHAAH